MDPINLQDSIASEAKELIAQLANHYREFGEYGGWFSYSLYDSAWVSLVPSPVEGDHWRFPQCFDHVLRTQAPEGSWASDDIQDKGDLIVTSLACLLSLQEHRNRGHNLPSDIDSRIHNAHTTVERLLESWDFVNSERIGVETLVPTLIRLLEKAGREIQFSKVVQLMALRDSRMCKFKPEELYKPEQHKLLHSLEGLVGVIDFDKVAHQKTYGGGMCVSPSSTAAYLINCSVWDQEAEAYLENVVKLGGGTGAIQSCFPSSTFELTWPLSFLLYSGFTREDLGAENVDTLADYLEGILHKNSGVSGLMGDIVPDCDSTARILLILTALGRQTQEQLWINRFEAPEYFKCITNERNASISVNCNVLNALVYLPNPNRYIPQIQKVVTFLCIQWYETGSFVDKWHLSPHYPMMLLAKALAKLLQLTTSGLITLSRELINHRIPILLIQLCARTLQHQQPHGGWGDNHEITAYATLTLIALAPLPYIKPLEQYVCSAILCGRAYLLRHRSHWNDHAYIWVGKTTYGSSMFARSFCLSAMGAKVDQWTEPNLSKFSESAHVRALDHTVRFLSSYLPLWKNQPEWRIRAWLVEGHLFSCDLAQNHEYLFPKKPQDRYFWLIASTFTAANSLNDFVFGAASILGITMLSIYIVQLDEFFEQDMAHWAHEADAVRHVIHAATSDDNAEARAKNGPLVSPTAGTPPSACRYSDHDGLSCEASSPDAPPLYSSQETSLDKPSIETVLCKFMSFIMKHPQIIGASRHDRVILRQRCRSHILAQFQQTVDSVHLASQLGHRRDRNKPAATFSGVSEFKTFYEWATTTSMSAFSWPALAQFMICCAHPPDGSDFFATARLKYLGDDYVRHLGTAGRLINNAAGEIRDFEGNNLNSLNWSEFHWNPDAGIDDRKTELVQLADYEKSLRDFVLEQIGGIAEKKIMDVLQMGRDANDIFAERSSGSFARDIGDKFSLT